MNLSKFDNVIYASTGSKTGRFDAKTGQRISGDLDIEPDEILFLAWRQTQSPKLGDAKLREMWLKTVR